MQNQRGFVGLPVLILIVLGLIVVGGGAYYVVHQQSASQTTSDNFDNLQQLPTTNNQSQTKTTTNAPAQTTPTQNPVAQCSTYDSKPVITSITPSSGPVGTTIEIQGCNFLGFEGDKEIWFTNSKGEKGFLNGQMDPATRASNTVTRVTLQQKLCQINSYSGLDCPILELAPGTYTVYSNSYGGKSNTVNFTVTDSGNSNAAGDVTASGNVTLKDWKIYQNIEFPIIFSHPTGWQCSTGRAGSPAQSEMLPAATTCYSGTVGEYPLFNISSPFTGDSPTAKSSNFTTLRKSIVIAHNAQSVQKTVYVLSSSGGASGVVEYVLAGSVDSYIASAAYDSREPSYSYKRAEDVENILDTVIKTINAK